MPTLLAEDYSFISRAILTIYLVASLHVMLVSYQLFIESKDLSSDIPEMAVSSNMRRYFSLLREPAGDQDESGELLIEVLLRLPLGCSITRLRG